MAADPLPELRWEMLEQGRTFRPFVLRVTPEMVAVYEQVVGERHELHRRFVPPGMAGILGRRSYLEDHRMPPGGILLRQSIRWDRPALLDEPMEAEATVRERTQAGDRRKVVMDTVVRQSGSRVATVAMTLGWPR